MGAVQSDLKANIVQASSGGKVIPPRDDEYWSTVCASVSTKEVSSLLTSSPVLGKARDCRTHL